MVQFHDISEQKRKDELIWRQTNFDVLTGLPNRGLFLDRLAQALKKMHGTGQRLGVLLLDLDRFKDINDSYGHAVGDNALVEITRRLAQCVSDDATIARLGGNMFALVVYESDEIGDLAHRLGIEAIAEGVETAAQRDILAALGCDYIQGYFYSAAVPQEAFERFLERQVVH